MRLKQLETLNSNIYELLFCGILDDNYTIITDSTLIYDYNNKRFGILTDNPTTTFSIAEKFNIDELGNITKIKNIHYNFPDQIGDTNTVLLNTGNNNLVWGKVSELYSNLVFNNITYHENFQNIYDILNTKFDINDTTDLLYSILPNYVLTSNLNTILSNYITHINLSTILQNYATVSNLNTAISQLASDVADVLDNYATYDVLYNTFKIKSTSSNSGSLIKSINQDFIYIMFNSFNQRIVFSARDISIPNVIVYFDSQLNRFTFNTNLPFTCIIDYIIIDII